MCGDRSTGIGKLFCRGQRELCSWKKRKEEEEKEEEEEESY